MSGVWLAKRDADHSFLRLQAPQGGQSINLCITAQSLVHMLNLSAAFPDYLEQSNNASCLRRDYTDPQFNCIGCV